MKKLITKFLFLFLLVFSSIVILNFFYINTRYWKDVVETSKFKNVPENIQIANIGSSHGLNDFDYSNIPYRSFNFALAAQYYLYDYALLRQYSNKFDKNAILIIPVSYFQITQIKTDFQDQRARYYSFLTKEHMDFYSLREKTLFFFFPILTAGDTFRFIFNDIDIPTRSKFMTESELIKSCNGTYIHWTTGNKNEHYFEAGEEGFVNNKNLVKKIVEFCYSNDIKPVLITTPIISILNNIYAEKSPDFFDNFYRFTRELQEVYPNLPYFDYSHDPRFENDFTLFMDADHLNIFGAEKFTAIVISDLQASGLLNDFQ